MENWNMVEANAKLSEGTVKKIMQITVVLAVLAGIYRYNQTGRDFYCIQKSEEENSTVQNSAGSGYEIVGEVRHTIVGDVEIIEKSFCAEDSVADMDGIGGTQLVSTWDMKYPYFRGEHLWFLKRVNDSIFEFVITKAFDGPREVLHDIGQTYEITYMDERFVSVLFEGGTSEGMSYSSYSRGMNFDLKTEERLSLEDFYTWPEWEKLMEDAMEQEQLSVQILEGYAEIDGEKRKEYLEEYFIPLFQEDSYIKQDNTYFYIKDRYLYFIAPPYPSCKQHTYVKWEVPFDMDAYAFYADRTEFYFGKRVNGQYSVVIR